MFFSVLALEFCFGEYTNIWRAFRKFTCKLHLVFHIKPYSLIMAFLITEMLWSLMAGDGRTVVLYKGEDSVYSRVQQLLRILISAETVFRSAHGVYWLLAAPEDWQGPGQQNFTFFELGRLKFSELGAASASYGTV